MKYAVVTDCSTQWFTYLVKYEMSTFEYSMEAYHDLPNRVNDTAFCKNIFDRPCDINNDEEMVINGNKGFYGWHVSEDDYFRIKELIKSAKVVDIFEKLSKCN